MSRELTNQVLILDGREFAIQAIIGRGASCVVYRAECPDKTEHLLKEYNPRHIAMYRESTGELCLESEEDREEFEAGLVRFREGHIKQRELRLDSDLKNSTSNVQGIYKANGTEYIDMTCFSGKTYDQVQEKSVYDLLRRMKALAQVIGNYHKAGLLHLDIKPENIFTLPETCEMVMLFDFDSVVSRESAAAGGARSYTLSWAAPEQTNPLKRNAICEATDIFAVGEMIFYQLMGKTRHSTTEERLSFAEYHFDRTLPIFENVNPKVFPLLEDLLHKTICVSIKQRYQTTADLIAALDRIIEIANPKEPYLKSSLPAVQDFFVGREGEIQEIHRKLNESNILFLNGIGGIGKSELAKHYAEEHKDDYDAIIFAPYVSDVNMLLLDDNAIPLYNFAPYLEEKPEEYCTRKLKKLRELCNERTLFIVDNLDREDDPDINKLLDLECKLLITTRMDFSDYGYGKQLYLDAMRSRDSIVTLFYKYYTKPLTAEEDDCVGQIIDLVAGHTMTVELLAKQMMAGRVKPEKMLAKLQEGGISESGKDKVRSGKDGMLSAKSASDHIQTLFDLSALNNDEQYILANLSLIPYTGISTELFHDLCDLEDYAGLNKLIIEGWMRHDDKDDYISLHPLIAELLLKNIDTVDTFDVFLKAYVFHNRSRNNSEVKESVFYTENDRINRHLLFLVERNQFTSKAFSSALLEIGGEFYILHQLELSERAYLQALRISQSIDNPKGFTATECMASLAFVRELKGSETNNSNAIRDAINIYLVAIQNFQKLDDAEYPHIYDEIATLYGYLGDAYYDLEDILNAELMYHEGIRIYERRETLSPEDYASLGILYNNLANIFSDYSKAIVFYNKAKENHIKSGFNSWHLARVYYHLADAYSESSSGAFNINLAVDYAQQSLAFLEKEYAENLYMIGEAKYMLGKVYLQSAELAYYQDAYVLLTEAKEVFDTYLSQGDRTIIKVQELIEKASKLIKTNIQGE